MSAKVFGWLFSKYFLSLSSAKKIAYIAVFIALGVVTNSLIEINVTASNRITFTYFVCFFAGFLLGPLPGFLTGFLGDAIGFLLVPQDVYWLFGLTLGLIGVLAGVARKLPLYGKKGVFFKACIFFVISYVLVTCFLNSLVNYWYVYLFIWQGTVKTVFWVWLGGRLAFQTIVYAVNVGVCAAVLAVLVPTRMFGFFKQELAPRQAKTEQEAPLPKAL